VIRAEVMSQLPTGQPAMPASFSRRAVTTRLPLPSCAMLLGRLV
jgi:hypothetical protein